MLTFCVVSFYIEYEALLTIWSTFAIFSHVTCYFRSDRTYCFVSLRSFSLTSTRTRLGFGSEQLANYVSIKIRRPVLVLYIALIPDLGLKFIGEPFSAYFKRSVSVSPHSMILE